MHGRDSHGAISNGIETMIIGSFDTQWVMIKNNDIFKFFQSCWSMENVWYRQSSKQNGDALTSHDDQ